MNLIEWDKIGSKIELAQDWNEIKQISDTVAAMRVWSQQTKQSLETQNKIAEYRLRLERKKGFWLQDNELAQGRRTDLVTKSDKVGITTLKELGMTRQESYVARQIASLPEQEFEAEIATARNEKKRNRVELSTSRFLKAASAFDKQAKRKEAAEKGKLITPDIDFRHGDFEEVFSDIPDGSVDCIITDPPYPLEHIECWTKLSRFASKKLKLNGFCIAYSGQMNLPEVIRRMSESLDYYWTFAVYHEGPTQIVNGVNVICRWKPILIYQNGKQKMSNTIQDYFISEQREKDGHDWQQSKSGIGYLVEMFTNEGDLICEPFAGNGTTIKVAIAKKRHIIAAEINMETYNIAKGML